MDVSEKKLRRKTLAQDVLTQDEGPHTDQVTCISARSLTLLSFAVCSGVGIVWSTTTRTQVSDATAVTFTLNVLTH